ncbi:MAG: T9SS type A sorting domain-containing protein, partial [Bacteroidales bacterium]|nr:T9SS type A sorting domain-containing protein [Bacteroidales bacterium]
MKKILSLLIVLMISTSLFSQTFISEDFSSGQMPPTGWLTLPIGSGWSSSSTSNAGGSSPEARFEGFNSNSTARMISPVIDLSSVDTVILLFKHYYDDNSGPGPAVGVATRGNTGWQSVWEITPYTNQGPEEIQVIIADENVGSPNFKFCFYVTGELGNLNNWYIDDIVLFNPPNLDGQMSNILIQSPIQGPEEVKGVVKNLGYSTINEVSVSWQSYAGVIYDSTFSGLSLELLDGFEFSFNQMWISPFGAHDIKMWINNVNGILDDNRDNDTLTKIIEYVAFSVPQRPCFEEFTSSTCPPCAGFNNSFAPWAQTHEDEITLVKYQMSWPSPGDPYYTAEGGARRTYYGVNSVPDMFCNGLHVGASMGAIQAIFNTASELTTNIDIASSFTMSGSNININTNILAFQNYGNKKVHTIVIEKVTTGNVGSNGETEFHHVMMKMFPNANGATVNLENGNPVSLTYNYDLSSTHVEEYDDLMVIVIIQDQQTKEMFQTDYGLDGVIPSSEARLSSITLDGIPLEGFDPDIYEYDVILPLGVVIEPVVQVETMDDGAIPMISQAFQLPGTAQIDVYAEDLITTKTYLINYTGFAGTDEQPMPLINIYPNPVKDQLYISGIKNAQLSIYTVEGKLMLMQKKYSGNAVDLSDLKRGVYILNVMTEESVVVRKKF